MICRPENFMSQTYLLTKRKDILTSQIMIICDRSCNLRVEIHSQCYCFPFTLFIPLKLIERKAKNNIRTEKKKRKRRKNVFYYFVCLSCMYKAVYSCTITGTQSFIVPIHHIYIYIQERYKQEE